MPPVLNGLSGRYFFFFRYCTIREPTAAENASFAIGIGVVGTPSPSLVSFLEAYPTPTAPRVVSPAV